MNRYFTSIFSSPVGNLRLIGSEQALMALLWSNDRPERVPLPTGLIETESEVLTQTKKQLAEYFEGKRQRFDLPLHMVGTDFQKLVWQQL